MTIKTILLPVEKAAFVQKNAAEFGCNLVELAISGKSSAKVTVTGEDDNVKKLFDEIGE